MICRNQRSGFEGDSWIDRRRFIGAGGAAVSAPRRCRAPHSRENCTSATFVPTGSQKSRHSPIRQRPFASGICVAGRDFEQPQERGRLRGCTTQRHRRETRKGGHCAQHGERNRMPRRELFQRRHEAWVHRVISAADGSDCPRCSRKSTQFPAPSATAAHRR